ncbi:MAG TPA: phenylalanine--tRNA ligase subunit alpha [Alphaproteobacteria bacterium]|nr:phenylalanine--tRNA ligase subunit alpha [Alphaproteobacteria bacterium]
MDLQAVLNAIAAAPDLRALDDVRVKYLGQNGSLTLQLRELGKLSPDERKTRGQELHKLKTAVEAAWAERKNLLENAELLQKLNADAVDVTLPGLVVPAGKIHPITAAMEEIADSLKRLGFVHAYGPEVESDEYNFTKLNLPPHHPARQDQDTFYLNKFKEDEQKYVLRTQTSNVQIRTLETAEPPFRVMGIGRVYRRDYDITHTPQFHQVEGMMVDKGVTFANMRAVLDEFIRGFFGQSLKTRFRPHYFPFTEPSAEMDMQCLFCKGNGCRVCKHSGWLEILGCGMVHRNVLAVGGLKIDEWQGFAFGAGVERLAMLKYGIGDLRLFFESHGAFVRHFGQSPVAAA